MARTDPRRQKPKRRYKIRGPETWALIRESYLAGASARELARRYDVTEWAIWRRAWKEEWTKRDRAEARAPEAPSPFALPGEATGGDPGALKRRALAGVERAMAAGRLDEAAELARLAASLGRIEAGAAAAGIPGPGRGEFTLADVSRALIDDAYASDLMRVDPDDPHPDPAKGAFWRAMADRSREWEEVSFGFRLFVEAVNAEGIENTPEARAAARAEVAEYKRWREAHRAQKRAEEGRAKASATAPTGARPVSPGARVL
jgi:hypothetical protein